MIIGETPGKTNGPRKPRYSAVRSRLKISAGASGLHVFDRTTGLNILLDEVQIPQALWTAAPRFVSVALTNACDLTCPYCFAPKNATALDVHRLFDWLDELDENGCLCVGFGGGEPTLYPYMAELCRYATHKTGLAVTFTTHACSIDHVLVAALSGCVNFVRVSMDGVGATYEVLRGQPFAALLRGLEAVRSLAPFGISFLVNDRTLPDLDSATLLASELGAAEFLLLPEQPVRGIGGIDDHTTRELRHWIGLYRGSVPLTVSEAGAPGLMTCYPLTGEYGLRAYAHIDATGVLKRCSFDSDGVVIGSGGVMKALDVLRTS